MDITKELLRECFDRYQCDKGKQHDYAGMYSEVFKELERVDRMLEIGFGAGRSGLAWRDALPNTQLTFLEKTPYEGILEEAKSLNMLVGNSARTSVVGALFNELLPYDVIIDDGDHRPDYQFQTFLNFETKWTGAYVIEDVIGVENEQLLRSRIKSRGYSAIRTYSSKLKDGKLRMNGKMVTDVRFFAIVIFPKGTVLNN